MSSSTTRTAALQNEKNQQLLGGVKRVPKMKGLVEGFRAMSSSTIRTATLQNQ